jgi:hypothetical protein
MPPRKPIPVSLTWFLVTGLVFAFQAAPVAGDVMVLLLAPLWSILLVNIGFVAIAHEALSGKVARAWVILPAIWFGGYLALLGHETMTLSRVRHEVSMANARVHASFDPKTGSLIVEHGFGANADAEEGGAVWFLRSYGLPVVYAPSDLHEGASHMAFRRAIPEACRLVELRHYARTAGISLLPGHGQPEAPCVVGIPEDPTGPSVRVINASSIVNEGGLHTIASSSRIVQPEGPVLTVRGGQARMLGWFPLPVMGCDPFSGRRCSWGLMRETYVPLHDPRSSIGSDGIALARALDLPPLNEVRPTAMQELLSAVEASVRRGVAAQTARLDKVLGDPTADVEYRSYSLLADRADVVAPRLERIMALLENQTVPQARNNVRTLHELLDRVTPEMTNPYRARIDVLRKMRGY